MKWMKFAIGITFCASVRAQEIDVYEKYDFYDVKDLAENFSEFKNNGKLYAVNCFYGGQFMLDGFDFPHKNAGFEFFELASSYLKNADFPFQIDGKLVSSENSFDFVTTKAIVQGADTGIVRSLATNTVKYYKTKIRYIQYLRFEKLDPKIFFNGSVIWDKDFAYQFNVATLGLNLVLRRTKSGSEFNAQSAYTTTDGFRAHLLEAVLSYKIPILNSGSNVTASEKYSYELSHSGTKNIADPKQALDYFLAQITCEIVIPNHTSSINFMASNYMYRATLDTYGLGSHFKPAYSFGIYLNIPFFLFL
jgi:hypothetical protein